MIPGGVRYNKWSRSKGGLYVVEDFIGSSFDTNHWYYVYNDTATAVIVDGAGGQLQMATGATAGSQGEISWYGGYELGPTTEFGRVMWRAKCNTAGANRCYYLGCSDLDASPSRLLWKWDNSVNSSRWVVFYVLDNVVTNQINTSISLDTTAFHTYEIQISSPDQMTAFYDGISQGSLTISTAYWYGPYASVYQYSAGATATMLIDNCLLEVTRT